jgi:hypothetical protein
VGGASRAIPGVKFAPVPTYAVVAIRFSRILVADTFFDLVNGLFDSSCLITLRLCYS